MPIVAVAMLAVAKFAAESTWNRGEFVADVPKIVLVDE
jgi:hypothetical protein